MVKISIKWNKEKVPDFELDKESVLIDLQSMIYSLTCVPVDKQKLIFKGSMIKADKDLEKLFKVSSAQLMLMGQPENSNKSIKEPEQKTVFMEDLTADQLNQIMKKQNKEVLPSGLVNMGNTCYLNSVLQCMKRMNELKQNLIEQNVGNSAQIDIQLINSLKRLMTQLDNKAEPITPYDFIDKFSMAFPHLAEQSNHGGFKQQDADESFQSLLQVMEPHLQGKDQEDSTFNTVQKLFNIEYETTFKNQEIEEPETKKVEQSKKFSCIVDNQGEPIDDLKKGIEVGLMGQLEKMSEVDGMNHIYNKKSEISRLPSYAVVQIVRFFWKEKSVVAGTDATKAKILRNISFPRILDLSDFCTAKLKEQLNYGKELIKKQEEQKKADQQERFEKYKEEQHELQKEKGMEVEVNSREMFKKFKGKEEEKEKEIDEHDELLYKPHGMGLETGNYELVAVLTHKGRTADSGHYVAWVHQRGDRWLKFDDEKVSHVDYQEVQNLRGGGDWHMAYYCIYRKLEIQ